ncbi:2-phospho-L-lactate guanylyltransferase [Rubrobacter taiwanensis]|uniref:2-phospho-L-lactate guanylyltransferase n=1 Tax=Rubrobacter taiwanensis TaxID=185139 RepID=UPI0014052C38|nr:2-phospho-L-lactate guanylyltransferase [Rubrobacter taiwanensis]
MRLFAAVPVRGLGSSKSRLGPVLAPGEREALVARMLGGVISALRESGCAEVCVVSPDPRALKLAGRAGARPLRQRGAGLNPALEEARRQALKAGAQTLLALPADLPLLGAGDVRELLAAGSACAISPDATDSGTNALLLRPPDALPFRFGPGSFRAHLEEAAARGVELRVCRTPGLAFDLDTPADLARLRGLKRAIS